MKRFYTLKSHQKLCLPSSKMQDEASDFAFFPLPCFFGFFFFRRAKLSRLEKIHTFWHFIKTPRRQSIMQNQNLPQETYIISKTVKTSQSYLRNSFPSVGPLQSFWKDWNIPFSPLVHFPWIKNFFVHLPVEVTELGSTQRKQSGRELSQLWKSHAALGKDHPAQGEWPNLQVLTVLDSSAWSALEVAFLFCFFPFSPEKNWYFLQQPNPLPFLHFHWKTGPAHTP